MRSVSVDKSIGKIVQHLITAQLAVGRSQFDTYVGEVMSGDKISVRLSTWT